MPWYTEPWPPALASGVSLAIPPTATSGPSSSRTTAIATFTAVMPRKG